MPIRFRCPSGHLLSIGAEHAGKRLRCPKCLKIATVPSASAPMESLPSESLPAELPAREPVALSVTGTGRAAATDAPPAPPIATPPAIAARTAAAPAAAGMPAVSTPLDRPASTVGQPPVERREARTNQGEGSDEKIETKAAAIVPPGPPARQSAPKASAPPIAAKPRATMPAKPLAPSKHVNPAASALPTPAPKAAPPPGPPRNSPSPAARAIAPPVVVPPAAPDAEPPAIEPPPLTPGLNLPFPPAVITPPPLPAPAPPTAQLAVRNPFAEDPRELAPVQFEGELQKAVAEQTLHPSRHALPAVIGYRPDRFKVHNVYLLAMGLLLLTLFNAAPAIKHCNLALSPDWARVVLFMTVVQVGFIVWMVLLPDWSTVWVSMLVFAGVATLYGVALAIAVVTPHGRPVALEMDDVRQNARLWCTAVILLTCSMTYLCGRLSHQWHKGYQLGR